MSKKQKVEFGYTDLCFEGWDQVKKYAYDLIEASEVSAVSPENVEDRLFELGVTWVKIDGVHTTRMDWMNRRVEKAVNDPSRTRGIYLNEYGKNVIEWEVVRNFDLQPFSWRELALLVALQDLEDRVKRLERK